MAEKLKDLSEGIINMMLEHQIKLEDLPVELTNRILSYLSYRDLITASSSCKSLRDAAAYKTGNVAKPKFELVLDHKLQPSRSFNVISLQAKLLNEDGSLWRDYTLNFRVNDFGIRFEREPAEEMAVGPGSPQFLARFFPGVADDATRPLSYEDIRETLISFVKQIQIEHLRLIGDLSAEFSREIFKIFFGRRRVKAISIGNIESAYLDPILLDCGRKVWRVACGTAHRKLLQEMESLPHVVRSVHFDNGADMDDTTFSSIRNIQMLQISSGLTVTAQGLQYYFSSWIQNPTMTAEIEEPHYPDGIYRLMVKFGAANGGCWVASRRLRLDITTIRELKRLLEDTTDPNVTVSLPKSPDVGTKYPLRHPDDYMIIGPRGFIFAGWFCFEMFVKKPYARVH